MTNYKGAVPIAAPFVLCCARLRSMAIAACGLYGRSSLWRVDEVAVFVWLWKLYNFSSGFWNSKYIPISIH